MKYEKRSSFFQPTAYSLVLAVLLVTFVVGCKPKEQTPEEKGKLHIVASFLPMYIFTANVVKGVSGIELDILLPPNGADPHEYSMTPADMKKLAGADVLVINGLGVESFMGDSHKKVNPRLKVIDASTGILTIPDVPPDRNWEGGSGQTKAIPNPHLWVSPSRAAQQVQNIAKALEEIDPANAQKYMQNADEYSAKLLELAGKFKETVAAFKNKKIVTIHNAFDYLAADSGLDVVAVLRMDPTAETRAAELAQIVNHVKAVQAGAIFAEPQLSNRLARVLSEETGLKIFSLNPLETGELDDDYYIKVMRSNLSELSSALGGK